MTQLNDRAFEILCGELRKCSGTEKLVQVQQDIVLKRLEKLRSSQGLPASLKELRHAILDIIPDFSENALKAAARANRPRGASLSKIKWVAGIIVGSAGILWVVNLPYAMIRLPVARAAPILLLPSYINMNYHYCKAMAMLFDHASQTPTLGRTPEWSKPIS